MADLGSWPVLALGMIFGAVGWAQVASFWKRRVEGRARDERLATSILARLEGL